MSASARLLRPYTPLPGVPSHFAASAVSSSEIDLSWTNKSDTEGVIVQRSLNNSTWATIATLGIVAAYQGTGLSGSTPYYYRVRATNHTGGSWWSSSANATTQSA